MAMGVIVEFSQNGPFLALKKLLERLRLRLTSKEQEASTLQEAPTE